MALFFEETVSAGFPSPAEGYAEAALDLNEYIVKNPVSTFFVRVTGDSMNEAGITPGDILVIDRSLLPRNGSVVLAVLNGEFTVKYFYSNANNIELRPGNPRYNSIWVRNDCEFSVWGVVTHAIHHLK